MSEKIEHDGLSENVLYYTRTVATAGETEHKEAEIWDLGLDIRMYIDGHTGCAYWLCKLAALRILAVHTGCPIIQNSSK